MNRVRGGGAVREARSERPRRRTRRSPVVLPSQPWDRWPVEPSDPWPVREPGREPVGGAAVGALPQVGRGAARWAPDWPAEPAGHRPGWAGAGLAARRAAVSLVAAAVVAVTALVGVVVSVPLRESVPAPRVLARTGPASSAASASSAAVTAAMGGQAQRALTDLLAARAAALLERDVEAWMAPVSTAAAAADYAGRQRRVFDHLAQVPLATWRWEHVGPAEPLGAERAAALGTVPAGGPARAGGPAGASASGNGAWVAHVVLVYQLEGGGGEVRREQYLTLVPDPATEGEAGADGPQWRLAGDSDGPTAVDLWDLGPVRVARGERVVVIGTGDVEPFVQVTDDAARRVDEVWGEDWPRRTLVEVPATQAELARLLGRDDEAGLEQIAAVTTGESAGGEMATTGDRVVVNPRGFEVLSDVGRRVVMTHELTHVATRASTSVPVPIWLGEGYADWVGYRGSGLARATVAGPVVREVREGRGPAVLATLDDFDPTRGDVDDAYAGSWVVVDLLARQHGEQALTSFYRAVAGAGPVEADLAYAAPARSADDQAATRLDAALRAHFGLDEAGLTRAWREELGRLAAEQEPAAAARPTG